VAAPCGERRLIASTPIHLLKMDLEDGRSTEYLEMFHENSDDDVDEHELCHQDEDDEEDRRDDWTDAAVVHTVVVAVAVVS